MFTVNLTEDQLILLQDLVGEKFNEVAQAWLPAPETEEMNKLSYRTLLALRTVKGSKEFDDHWNQYNTRFAPNKIEYLKEVHLCSDEDLAQQGIY